MFGTNLNNNGTIWWKKTKLGASIHMLWGGREEWGTLIRSALRFSVACIQSPMLQDDGGGHFN